jgi:hypothetical protein
VAKESVLVSLLIFSLLVAGTVTRNCAQIEVPSFRGRDAWADIVIADPPQMSSSSTFTP